MKTDWPEGLEVVTDLIETGEQEGWQTYRPAGVRYYLNGVEITSEEAEALLS